MEWSQPSRPVPNMRYLCRLLIGVLVSTCLLGLCLPGAAEAAGLPGNARAGEPSIEAAVEHYLSTIPADYHAIRSVPALKRALASTDSLLVDVRSSSEYRAGHIPGAVNIPLDALGEHVADIPAERQVVLYCSTGYRSAMGVMALQLEGRQRAMGFPPSLAGWQAAGEPLERSAAVGERPV